MAQVLLNFVQVNNELPVSELELCRIHVIVNMLIES